MKRVLFVRQDNNGDVLLTGPAVRAIAASGAQVVFLCSPRGAGAARMLPGVAEVLVAHNAWIDAEPAPVDEISALTFVELIRSAHCDEAIISTSFHQSPLPTALLLRMAGVSRIGAISVDYPGSLLNIRHAVSDDIHEVDRNLSLVRAMGYLPASADDRMQITIPDDLRSMPFGAYVVVHPGATVPARTLDAERFAATIALLAERGYRVIVTGSGVEAGLTAAVSPNHPSVMDLGGRTSFAEFTAIVRDAQAVICGNTATAHVAAAVGTPVVSIFPPTIPSVRFAPWRVPHVLLGEQDIACAGCRARRCPIAGQPCLAAIEPQTIVAALELVLVASRDLPKPEPVHETPHRSTRLHEADISSAA